MFFEAHVYLHKDFSNIKNILSINNYSVYHIHIPKNEYKLNYTNADISFHVNRQ